MSEETAAQAGDELRWQLYNDHKKQAWADIQSSTDSYDNNLITLSSGGLGVSIAFIKEIVHPAQATSLWMLYVSWVCFGLCILTTVISFQIAIKTQKEHLVNCGKYYLDKDDSYRDKAGKYSKALTGCTIFAGVFFVLALAFTIVFAVSNIARNSTMTDDGKKLREGRAPIAITAVPETPADENRGRAPVAVTPLPTQTTQSTQTEPKTTAPATTQPKKE